MHDHDAHPAPDDPAERRHRRVDHVLVGRSGDEHGGTVRAADDDDFALADDLELAAAELAAALQASGDDAGTLPAGLRARVLATVPRPGAARDAGASPAPLAMAATDDDDRGGTAGRIVAWLGWAAAAACLAYAAIVSMPEPVRTLEAQRVALIESADDEVLLRWKRTAHPAGEGMPGVAAQGDVVWSPSADEGFARFCHLAVNDPETSTYQLWVVDPDRPDDRPVSAGVFDVRDVHEWVVIEMRPALPIDRPGRCTVTLAPRGGSVVPGDDPVVLTTSVRPGGE